MIMITVNFTLSWFATWVEARMRRSRRGTAPLDSEAVEQEVVPGPAAP
ncbi:hypothetical protein [Mycolicibacterium pulveris]